MPGVLAHPFAHSPDASLEELGTTFAAEITGLNLSNGLSGPAFEEVRDAVTKYGVVMFRQTNLNDESHINLGRQFGELDDIRPYIAAGRKNRLKYPELFDVGNVEEDGSLVDLSSPKGQHNKGNSLFHVDSSFNPRRAGYSLLLAHSLPPAGNGGATAFIDTRTAFDDLDPLLKDRLQTNDYIAYHSMHHSRKLASPEFFADLDPLKYPMGKHRLVQRHEPSGRMNLYVAAHVHHIEGGDIDADGSKDLFESLYGHACQDKYKVEIEWRDPGDMIIWDNTCVMHRSVGGGFVGKYPRDMRRVTVHDGSSQAWGLNDKSALSVGMP